MTDQLRDRRTLFTVVVLPLLLYPLLGISLIQITQFFRERPSVVWLAGAEWLPDEVPLLKGDQLDARWLAPGDAKLIQLHVTETAPAWMNAPSDAPVADSQNEASNLDPIAVRRGLAHLGAHAAVFIRPALPVLAADQASDGGTPSIGSRSIHIFIDSANDASGVAAKRIDQILRRWKSAVIENNLAQQQVERHTWQVWPMFTEELAEANSQRTAMWSKILPLILVLWCLTGAFYPAVDICAGEKERGTFETILSSPAIRAEIAWGKLLTVASFSSATAILNMASLTFTAMFVANRMGAASSGTLGALGLPPWSCLVWIPLVIVPVALFFSAVSLAAAAFARSSKEGQYYLVPLIMISMPLMMLTLVPAAHLELGTSVIPVTGLMLLLRGLIEGRYSDVLPYVAPVCLAMLACVWGSVRWVILQFNSEAVLFRASERFGIGLWIRRMLQERGLAPTIGQAMLCFLVILLAKFFLSFSLEIPHQWNGFAVQTVTILLAAVAVPAILMAVVLTKSPRLTLKLDRLRWIDVALAAVLAIALHPLFLWLSQWILVIYPASEGLVRMNQIVGELLAQAPSLWAILLVLALFPALAEEIAFRGFILSGWQRLRSSWSAVIVSAFCFGAAHAVFQQSVVATAVGIVLGIIAIRTGSLIPCVVYHAIHNALSVCLASNTPLAFEEWLPVLERNAVDGSLSYSLGPALIMSICGMVLLICLWRDRGRTPGVECSQPSFAPHPSRTLFHWLRGLVHPQRLRR